MRHVVVLILSMLLVTACARTDRPDWEPAAMPTVSSTEQTIRERVEALETEYDCRLGVVVVAPSLGVGMSWRGEELFHAASTMKIPVMVEVFRRADEGEFSLAETIVVDPWFKSMLDGSPYECDSRAYLSERLMRPVPILTLTEQMMVVSDNLATNLLITRVEPPRITAAMRALGAEDGYVVRCLQDEAAYRAGFSNRISARDLARLLAAIEEDRAASPESCAEMRRILLDQRFRDMIPAELPEGVRVGHKTGSITRIRHDAGIVYAPFGAYYVVILSEGIQRGDRASGMIAGLSRFIYDQLEQTEPR